MFSRNVLLACTAISLIAYFKGNFEDVFMDEGLQFSASGPSKKPSGGYLRGLLNGVPKYDTCAPPDGQIPASKPGDAPFSQGHLSYEKALHCPGGIHNYTRGIVLLIPCTSCEASEAFAKTPLGVRLPQAGFDLCWMNLPFHGLGDMQLSGEFVAYAIGHLAAQSTTGKINVVAYSQGGTNAQWAITFWPSIQAQITNLVTIGAPHSGSTMSRIVCAALNLLGGCLTPILQMAPEANYMTALYSKVDRASGKQALVPTTSIYTYADQIVYPQSSGPEGVSYLSGASNIALQDACGRGHIVEHFGIIVDMATYGLVYDALTHGRPASLSSFDVRYCQYYYKHFLDLARGLPLDIQLTWRTLFGGISQRAGMIKNLFKTWRVPSEPRLMKYVCQQGYAPRSSCSDLGFCNNNPTRPLLGRKIQVTGSGIETPHKNPS